MKHVFVNVRKAADQAKLVGDLATLLSDLLLRVL
jgi:hypothetical protein